MDESDLLLEKLALQVAPKPKPCVEKKTDVELLYDYSLRIFATDFKQTSAKGLNEAEFKIPEDLHYPVDHLQDLRLQKDLWNSLVLEFVDHSIKRFSKLSKTFRVIGTRCAEGTIIIGWGDKY